MMEHAAKDDDAARAPFTEAEALADKLAATPRSQLRRKLAELRSRLS